MWGGGGGGEGEGRRFGEGARVSVFFLLRIQIGNLFLVWWVWEGGGGGGLNK